MAIGREMNRIKLIAELAATTIDMGIKQYLFSIMGCCANPDDSDREEWFRTIGKPVADELIKIETQLLKGAEPEATKGFIKDEEDMRRFLQLLSNYKESR